MHASPCISLGWIISCLHLENQLRRNEPDDARLAIHQLTQSLERVQDDARGGGICFTLRRESLPSLRFTTTVNGSECTSCVTLNIPGNNWGTPVGFIQHNMKAQDGFSCLLICGLILSSVWGLWDFSTLQLMGEA